MKEQDNCLSIIDDNTVNRRHPIKTKRTKYGYRIKYKKNNSFLEKERDIDIGDFIGFTLVFSIVVGGLTLLLTSLCAWVPAWFIMPLFTLGMIIYCSINAEDSSIHDWLSSLCCFLVSIAITWAVLCSTYKGVYNNREMHYYVKEKVNSEWLFIKGE